MKRYLVAGQITISTHTVVEASSAKKALEIAQGRSVTSLCAQCASGNEDEEWVTSGELDGEPQAPFEVTLEDAHD